MVSWLEELERREAAARDRIAELRGQIEELMALLVEQQPHMPSRQLPRPTQLQQPGHSSGPQLVPMPCQACMQGVVRRRHRCQHP